MAGRRRPSTRSGVSPAGAREAARDVTPPVMTAAQRRAWRRQVGEGAFSPDFHAASELIGRRWTGAIVRSLFHGKTRFREIADAVPGLSDRLLSERLRELTIEGIVEADPQGRGYRLTEKGRDLRRVLIEIARWAHRWRTAKQAQSPPDRQNDRLDRSV